MKKRMGRPKGYKHPKPDPIAPPEMMTPAAPVDMKAIERAPHLRRSKLRSLEANITRAIEDLLNLRRQVTQLAQEDEA